MNNSLTFHRGSLLNKSAPEIRMSDIAPFDYFCLKKHKLPRISLNVRVPRKSDMSTFSSVALPSSTKITLLEESGADNSDLPVEKTMLR